jgi:hypothetical protein
LYERRVARRRGTRAKRSVPVKPIPTPEPTPDWSRCTGADMCYQLRDYHFWFRDNANNFGESLRTWVTIYDYRMMNQYHWHSVSWGSRAFFLQKPDAGMKYLFIFINIYSDAETKATQPGYGPEHFAVQVKNKLYYMDEGHDPAVWIKELTDDANAYDYAHVQGVIPYGYKIVQNLKTGIISAEQLNLIYPGRSNAWDGYLLYQIPADATPDQIKVVTSFDNLGGRAMWQLK